MLKLLKLTIQFKLSQIYNVGQKLLIILKNHMKIYGISHVVTLKNLNREHFLHDGLFGSQGNGGEGKGRKQRVNFPFQFTCLDNNLPFRHISPHSLPLKQSKSFQQMRTRKWKKFWITCWHISQIVSPFSLHHL